MFTVQTSSYGRTASQTKDMSGTSDKRAREHGINTEHPASTVTQTGTDCRMRQETKLRCYLLHIEIKCGVSTV